MKKLFNRLILNYIERNLPPEINVTHIKTIYVKKGKIREWRSYDSNHNRIELIK
jgi:hypothetical protein